eukprot:scaffold535_cov260-Pinguiococcus_pyrenoidosus.AAC.28
MLLREADRYVPGVRAAAKTFQIDRLLAESEGTAAADLPKEPVALRELLFSPECIVEYDQSSRFDPQDLAVFHNKEGQEISHVFIRRKILFPLYDCACLTGDSRIVFAAQPKQWTFTCKLTSGSSSKLAFSDRGVAIGHGDQITHSFSAFSAICAIIRDCKAFGLHLRLRNTADEYDPLIRWITVSIPIHTTALDSADEARLLDAGAQDAGEQDSGAQDAGERDSGAQDAGERDSGAQDAGPFARKPGRLYDKEAAPPASKGSKRRRSRPGTPVESLRRPARDPARVPALEEPSDCDWILIEDQPVMARLEQRALRKLFGIEIRVIQTPQEVSKAVETIQECLAEAGERRLIVLMDENLYTVGNDVVERVPHTSSQIRDALFEIAAVAQAVQDGKLILVAFSTNPVADSRVQLQVLKAEPPGKVVLKVFDLLQTPEFRRA